MSFSTEVKDELLSVQNSAVAERAMGYGMLLYGRRFSRNEISLLTEHRPTAEKYASVIASATGETPEIIETGGHKFKICITDKEQIKTVFSMFEVIGGSMLRRVNSGILDNQENICSFLRGAFLVCGTVVDPEKEYHLEFAVPTGNLAKDIISVMSDIGEEFTLNPKITDRNGAHIVYIKKSENIEDMLGLMGAGTKALTIMGIKMEKDVRNTVNRRINFESANMARTALASAKQYDAIIRIQSAYGLDKLPSELREVAEIRLSDRELSSAEISTMLKKPLSVSGVNHRFAKLIKMAEEIE